MVVMSKVMSIYISITIIALIEAFKQHLIAVVVVMCHLALIGLSLGSGWAQA